MKSTSNCTEGIRRDPSCPGDCSSQSAGWPCERGEAREEGRHHSEDQ